jgi:hypothetical protein
MVMHIPKKKLFFSKIEFEPDIKSTTSGLPAIPQKSNNQPFLND